MTDEDIRAFIEFARKRPQGALDLVWLYDDEDEYGDVRTTYDYPSENHLTEVINEFMASRKAA